MSNCIEAPMILLFLTKTNDHFQPDAAMTLVLTTGYNS